MPTAGRLPNVSIQLISLASREAIKRLPDGYTLTVFPFN